MQWNDILSLIGSILAVGLILYLTYYFSKMIAKKANKFTNNGSIKIVERVALGQDKGLAVAEISEKYYLIGIANNGISMLMELQDYSPPQISQQGKDFSELFKANLLKRSGQKAGETDEQDSD